MLNGSLPGGQRLGGFVLWSLSTGIAWGAGALQPPSGGVRTLQDFAYVVMIVGLNGLLVGVIAGALQWASALRGRIDGSRWTIATAAGYFLAETVGVVLALGIPWALITLSGNQGPNWFYTPTPQNLIFGGFLVGVFQWRALRGTLIRAGARQAGLWILGSWAGVALGIFIGGWFEGRLLGFLPAASAASTAGRVIGGLTHGSITGLVMLILAGVGYSSSTEKQPVR